MVVVRGKSPVINRVSPSSRPEQQEALIWISGEGFTGSSSVTIGGVSPAATTLLPDGRLQCRLASGQVANEEAPVVVSEGPYDSIPFPFAITPGKPQLGDYIHPVEDQQQLVLPASFKGRTDVQRIPAGGQFTGTTPDDEQGDLGDAGGPTTGGYWTFNQKVRLKEFEWNSYNASGVPTAEPAARSAGSGIFLIRANGSQTLLVDLANQRLSAIVSDIDLNKGDAIKVITIGATLEMTGSLNHVCSSRRLTE